MSLIKEKLEELKEKVNKEISLIGYHNELGYVKSYLNGQITEYEINLYHTLLDMYKDKQDIINNFIEGNCKREDVSKLKENVEKLIDYSLVVYPDFGKNISKSYNELLTKYYAWLDVFYDTKINLVNKTIVDSQNQSVFDNGLDSQIIEINEYKNKINEVIKYCLKHYPDFGKNINNYFKDLNKYYEDQYKIVLEYTKYNLNKELGIIDNPDYTKSLGDKLLQVSKKPIISFYPDVYTLRIAYIERLKKLSLSYDNIKIFQEKDYRIKNILKKAYGEITEESVIEEIKKIESNYYKNINNYIQNGFNKDEVNKIQESFLEQCNNLDKLVEHEVMKKDYYNKIVNMTLNYNPEIVLDICNYVEKNNLFEDELYDKLYIIVEKEKYLYKKYNNEPVIYQKLSDKVKNILERIFIDRLCNYDQEDASNMALSLKKNGYLNTFDKLYYEFYDNHSFDNKITFDIEPPKYRIFHYVYKLGFINEGSFDKYKLDLLVSDREDIAVMKRSGAKKGEKKVSIKNCNNYVLYHDWIIVKYSDSFVAIDNKTGKTKRIRNLLYSQVGKYLMAEKAESTKVFYDSNIKKQKTISDVYAVRYDCKKNLYLIDRKSINETLVLDENLNCIKTININEKYDCYAMKAANDGVITYLASYQNQNYIMYYDYINSKVIDAFCSTEKGDYNLKNLVYNEGLYPFIDESKVGKYGFKDLDGNIVISPDNYICATPFMNNISLVKREALGMGIIDRLGNFTPMKDIMYPLYKSKMSYFKNFEYFDSGCLNYLVKDSDYSVEAAIKPDYYEGKLIILDPEKVFVGPYGYLVANCNYVFEINEPIKDIDFNEEKAKIKKRVI